MNAGFNVKSLQSPFRPNGTKSEQVIKPARPFSRRYPISDLLYDVADSHCVHRKLLVVTQRKGCDWSADHNISGNPLFWFSLPLTTPLLNV